MESAEIDLDETVVAELDEIFEPSKVAGARYGQSWMQSKDTAKND